MKKYSYIVVPGFDSVPHNVLFELIAEELGKKILRNLNFVPLWVKLINFLFCIPVFIVFFIKRRYMKIEDFYFFDVNIGYGVNQECVSRSMDGIGYDVLLSFRVFKNAMLHYWVYGYLLKKQLISIVLMGDEVYSSGSVISQMASLNNVPVKCLSQNMFHMMVSDYCSTTLNRYGHLYFDKNENLKEDSLSEASRLIKSRIAGDWSSLVYMRKGVESPWCSGLDAQSLVVYLHDFYDSPGIYGCNIFLNHVEWLRETIKYGTLAGHKVYIKPHPNQRQCSNQLLLKLRDEFKHNSLVKFIDDLLSLITVKESNSIVVTVYGSVIVEAAYLGVRVITAGRSPYDKFRLSARARSLDEYKSFLTNPIACFNDYFFDGLQERAVEALASLNSARSKMSTSETIVYDDISENDWKLVYGEKEYPSGVHERRAILLTDSDLRPRLRSLMRPRIKNDLLRLLK